MAETWHADELRDGILPVRIDRSDRPVNTFSRRSLDELAEIIARVRRDPTIRGVVFRSAKPGNFIAGADLSELRELAGAQAARELSEHGQRVFADLAALDVPTVALISGACLGGGLEFSLACTYRIADDHRKTLLGLPEVRLGLIPGWGGTVRLPRAIGLRRALPMILTGERVNGRQARHRGLVHDVVPTEALEHVAAEIVRRHVAAAEAGTKHAKPLFWRSGQPRWRRWIEETRAARKLMLRMAERQVLSETHGHYPAPIKAIAVLRAGLVSEPAGFAAESAAIAELSQSPVTTELVRLFFLSEDAKKPPADVKVPIRPDAISNVAVIGAGTMGAGIAQLLAERGIWVRLKDVQTDYLSAGLRKIRQALDKDVARRRVSRLDADRALQHISPTTDYTGMGHADVVIEAVLEEIPIKQQVFRDLAAVAAPAAVLATNTSSLRVEQVTPDVPHPERVLGIHFFNPPHRMPLVEVVRTERTAPEAIATALALVERIGKTPMVVQDCAGFLVNRLLVPYLNEVGYLLVEGATPAAIEQAAIQFGFPMGPLELMDLVGLDVSAHVAENMHRAYGARMEPAPLWQRLRELRAADAGGKKKKGGDKLLGRDWRRRRRLTRPAARMVKRLRKELGERRHEPYAIDTLIERMVYPVINEAARAVDEHVVERPEQIDLAMVFGTGFAPFRGGPLRYAEHVGLARIVATLEQLAVQHPRLAPSDALRRRAAEGRSFLEPIPSRTPVAVA